MKTKLHTPQLAAAAIMMAAVWLLLVPRPAAAVSVTSISTNILSPGSTQLTITGSAFGSLGPTDEVCFNETISGTHSFLPCVNYASGDFVSWSDTQIVVKVPADPDGTMSAGYLAVYADDVLADNSPLYHLQPVITSIDRSSVIAGSKVVVTGKYFTDLFGIAEIITYYITPYFNGSAGTTDYTTVTKSEMTVTVPSGATTGPLTMDFTVQPSGPTITATGPSVVVWQPITDDPYSLFQQYLLQVNVDRAWKIAGTGRAPVVAVIDDGVYINHPDLRYNIWKNTKERLGNNKDDDHNGYVDDVYGWNFITNQGEMTVHGTHGTLVAGIIGAAKNNQVGITGINPLVKIMPLIVCDDTLGCPFVYVSKAIIYAVDNGATVINLSLSTQATTGYSASLSRAMKYAYEHGVIVVVAAGNGDLESGIGQDLGVIPQSPVCNDIGRNAVIGVGAVDSSGYLTTWSNFGKCVDAYAPGLDIISTAVPKYSTLGDYYDIESGTSFASPIVAGIVALLRQKYPYMSNPEVVKRIINGTNENNVIDAEKVLAAPYRPAVITRVSPQSITTRLRTGERTITLKGKRFNKKAVVSIGSVKAKVQFVNATTLTVTFPLSGLSYGKNLITITGSNKQSSIFRWLELAK